MKRRNSSKELFISAPWGKLALLTWGEPSSPAVLMMHGRQDSAATFIPLVDVLPNDFYYVAVDLPGHGRSDTFPKGLVLSRYHFIHVVEAVVKYMEWKKFIFLGHSMGCEIGLFYNASTPGLISRFVHLDPGPTFQRLQQPDHEQFYQHYYQRYYDNYKRYNGPNRIYTERQALAAVVKARKVNEDQARILLARNLVHVEGDKYRLSWDSRSKHVTPQNLPNDIYATLFTTNAPPSLLVSMTEGHGGNTRGREGADYLIAQMLKNIKHSRRIVLKGGHDHHITHPEEIRKCLQDFLYENFDDVKSKL